MDRIASHRPSPALVVSLVALFALLSGTSYAAGTKLLPTNSVGSAQVVNGSLQKIDLSRRAIAALKGNRGPEGQTGAQGPAGPAGTAGAPGPAGPVALHYIQHTCDNPPNTQSVCSVTCPATHPNVAGGGVVGSGLIDQSINSSFPTFTPPGGGAPSGWFASLNNTSPTAAYSIRVYAVCTTATTTSISST